MAKVLSKFIGEKGNIHVKGGGKQFRKVEIKIRKVRANAHYIFFLSHLL